MKRPAVLAASAVAALALSGAAGAATLDHQIAGCAHELLGQRDNPPAVVCSHDGMTMTFATFGAMVEHMQTMH